jgi:hypothetical protein
VTNVRAHQILLMLPVGALIVIAVAMMRSMTASRKNLLPREDTPATPHVNDWVNAYGGFREAVDGKNNFDAQATPAPVLSSRSASATPTKLDNAEAVAPKDARLVDLTGRYKCRSFPIPATGVTLGRSPYASDIVLGDSRVSARHAWIGFVDGKPVLRDLKSTNGTFLNGQADSLVAEVVLWSGDTMRLGSHEGEPFQFVMEEAFPEQSPADRRK